MLEFKLEVGETYHNSLGQEVSITGISNVNSEYIYVGDNKSHYNASGQMLGGLVGVECLQPSTKKLIVESDIEINANMITLNLGQGDLRQTDWIDIVVPEGHQLKMIRVAQGSICQVISFEER